MIFCMLQRQDGSNVCLETAISVAWNDAVRWLHKRWICMGHRWYLLLL